MSDNVIQCPSCSKKYRLPDSPPATFQCRNCGTVMDLSAYQPETPRAPVAPARPGRGAPASGPTAPPPGSTPHRHGPVGGRRHGRVASHRARHGQRGAADEEYEDEGRPHYHRDRGPNTGLIIGSIAAVVIALVLLFVMLSSQKDRQPEAPPVAQQPQTPVLPPPQNPPDEDEDEQPVKPPPKPAPGREDEARPELREGILENVPIPEGKRKYTASQAEIKTYDWPSYVSAEDRNKIEAAIENLWMGGRDMTEAEDYLVSLDKYPTPGTEFRAVGRVVSEFKNVLDRRNNDLSNPMTMADLMVLDRILRRIDGMQERDFSDREGITHATTDTHAKTVMKRWNWWYDLEKWRMRREPWDVSEDLKDPDAVDAGDDEDLPPR